MDRGSTAETGREDQAAVSDACGPVIAVSGVFRTQLRHLVLAQLGTDGRSFSTGLNSAGAASEELGVGGRVVIGASGRLWWNLSSNFPVIIGFPDLLVTQ